MIMTDKEPSTRRRNCPYVTLWVDWPGISPGFPRW